MSIIDLTGRKFRQLTVIAFSRLSVSNIGSRTRFWICQCSCGAVLEVAQSHLTGCKVSRCPECQERHAANPTPKEQVLPDEKIKRHTVEGFCEYFCKNPYMFWDTFGRPYSEEAAIEEFEGIAVFWSKMEKEDILRVG